MGDIQGSRAWRQNFKELLKFMSLAKCSESIFKAALFQPALLWEAFHERSLFSNRTWTFPQKNPIACYTKYALLIVEAIYCHCTVVILKNAHLVLSVNYLALVSARSFFLFLECINVCLLSYFWC